MDVFEILDDVKAFVEVNGITGTKDLSIGEVRESRWGHQKLSSVALDYLFNSGVITENKGGFSKNPLHLTQAIKAAQEGKPAPSQTPTSQMKDIGIGAQILIDLGISRIKLLTNSEPSHYVGMSGYGLEIVDYVSY